MLSDVLDPAEDGIAAPLTSCQLQTDTDINVARQTDTHRDRQTDTTVRHSRHLSDIVIQRRHLKDNWRNFPDDRYPFVPFRMLLMME